MKVFLTEIFNIFSNKIYLSQGDDFLKTEKNLFSKMRLPIDRFNGWNLCLEMQCQSSQTKRVGVFLHLTFN